MVRFADDWVLGFQYKTTALRYLEELKERLKEYGLKLHPEKTRLIEFGKYAEQRRRERGERKPESFEFLGLTHLCSKNRKGNFFLRRKISTKRLRQTIKETKETLRRHMHAGIHQTGLWLKSVLTGFGQYFGVPGNMEVLKRFRDRVMEIWLKVLRRRSQKGNRMTWKRFRPIAELYIPRLRICHEFPEVRFAMTQGKSRMR